MHSLLDIRPRRRQWFGLLAAAYLIWFAREAHAAPTVYLITAPNFVGPTNFTACPGGICANYTTAMRVSGEITIANSLAANLTNFDVTASVMQYTLSDGITTFDSGADRKALFSLRVSTDSAGAPIGFVLQAWQWQAPGLAHATGQRLNQIVVTQASAVASNNGICDIYVAGGDDCSQASFAQANGSSLAGVTAATTLTVQVAQPAPAPAPQAVPALSAAGMAALALLLLLGACGASRRSPNARHQC